VRTKEQEVAYQEQKRVEERAAALALSQAMLEELLPSVLEGLAEAGEIPAPVQKGQYLQFFLCNTNVLI
jgi:Radial spoke protein 3